MSEIDVFEPGDVVYGSDPFKGEEAARPWLVISNHEGRPFHGDQYIALTLTTSSWHDGLVELEPSDWVHGGTPDPSNVAPWSVQSIGHDDIDFWQGRITEQRYQETIDELLTCIEQTNYGD